ncbi:MAG: M48 family metallopeptidase [Bacteroidales bacterium]|nr:M48 family metallopeptidase [Bacteroidales bacterium]
MIFIFRRRRRKKKALTAEQAAEVERLRAEAKAALPPRLAQLAALHGFTYNKVRIKHNSSNWGSCSELGNINLNLNLMRLPEHLRDFVMLHELCHLRYLNHGPEFHSLLESVCPGHRALARELKTYRLL